MKDYKKLYEEALERAKDLHDNHPYGEPGNLWTCEQIFPELKKIDDEEIRKAILELVKQSSHILNPMNQKSMIAWLEKQGEKLPVGFYYVNSNGEKFYSDTLKYGDVTVHVEKQGEQKETLCDKCRREQPSHFCQDITALGRCALEHQGEQILDNSAKTCKDEQKHADNVEPKFKVGDTIEYFGERKELDNEPHTIECINEDMYVTTFGKKISFKYQDCYRIVKVAEQKSADKIKPKFKVGDWVVCNPELCFESPLCIKDIDNNNYRVESVDGCSGVPTIGYLDNYYHLWTIGDAEEGDVLVYEGEFFIIKFYVLWHKIVYHCCYDGKNLHKYSIYDSWRKEDFDKVHPATKEQRKLLFSKMKEAGYEWDDKKKELKEIDNEDVNGEEMLNDAIGAIYAADYYTYDDKQEIENWIKSLKDRI